MANLSDLPLELLSHISSLLPPPYYPSSSSLSSPPSSTWLELDPVPPPASTAQHDLASLSRTSSSLLGAARPWLWEHVDVRSGRGWLAVVNALTEEVIEQLEILPGETADPVVGHFPAMQQPGPVSAEQAHAQPATLPGNLGRYISQSTAAGYPSPYPIATSGSTSTGIGLTFSAHQYSYSPPQPSSAHLLLTPPGSRNSSPNPGLPASAPIPPLPLPPSVASSGTTSTSKLRGRSRSPRRTINFDTEGISAILDRSRSTSSHGSYPRRRIPLERRRSSLSRHRTMSPERDDADEDALEGEDQLDELPRGRRSLTPASQRMLDRKNEGRVVEKQGEELEDPMEDEGGEAEVRQELLPPPGPYIRHLSFTNFRTIGSRRTQDEAVRGRFVTAGRLEGVIKNAPNLLTLQMTEYVDSSLSFPVLEELFFRGYTKARPPRHASSTTRSLSRIRSISADPNLIAPPSPAASSQLDPPRPTYVPYEAETDSEMWRRRAMFTPLQALDLTGCVSGAFKQGMDEFYETWLAPEEVADAERGRGRSRHRHGDTDDEDEVAAAVNKQVSRRRPRFSAMKRLSLRACTSLSSPVIHALLDCFPSLTHLDLSNTSVPSALLRDLTARCSRTLRLESLSLARCPKLDPAAIVGFLVDCPATHHLTELNLFVNPTLGNAIEEPHLSRLLAHAPSIKSGQLRYLDLSSAALTAAHLADFPAQPKLISLGLSHIPQLALPAIASFLVERCPNVEILTLVGTSLASLPPSASSLQLTLELHARLINPLTTVPFSLDMLSLHQPRKADLRPGPTRLRVIELSSPVRRAMADGGKGEWKVIKSKGGRGWYVDVSAGWIRYDEVEDGLGWKFARHLPEAHQWRRYLTGLHDANGRVGSGVGWHSRKMEIVRGWGMLGREGGLAGVGGYAFEE